MSDLPTELMPLTLLKRHPRNYQKHPHDQIEHLAQSIREHGIYRNIVIARDNTILAGHGVTQAAELVGLAAVPCVRLDIDPFDPRALKLLAGDNEVRHLAEPDDRLLSELLKEIKDSAPTGLLGTGFDELMLANLVMVTRPKSEISDFNEAAEWVGLPGYDNPEERFKLTITFRSKADREQYVAQTKLRIDKREAVTWTTWWPYKPHEKLSELRFEG